jgi:hypothetical protein
MIVIPKPIPNCAATPGGDSPKKTNMSDIFINFYYLFDNLLLLLLLLLLLHSMCLELYSMNKFIIH